MPQTKDSLLQVEQGWILPALRDTKTAMLLLIGFTDPGRCARAFIGERATA